MDGTAIAYAGDQLDRPQAKTTHGLIRGSERYQLIGVIDREFAGQEAGEILDGKPRQIPVFRDLDDFLGNTPLKADYLILGVANAGGVIDPGWKPLIRQAISSGMSIVNGLHEFLSEDPELQTLAEQHGVELIDVRKPKPKAEQHFWSGKIYEVDCPIIPVLGTDCAVGKRTTARLLKEACLKQGIRAEMIYTGQTGWMQGGKYGFIFDSTLNDFVSGELEHAIYSCWEAEKPEVIFVEGQAALRNPSGPCGSEFLVSGRADGVILVHPPARTYHKGWDHLGCRMPDLPGEITLVEAYGPPVIGLALNTKGLTLLQAQTHQDTLHRKTSLPVALPVEEGVDSLIPAIRNLISLVASKRGDS